MCEVVLGRMVVGCISCQSFMALEGGLCSSASLGVQGWISGLLEPSWLGGIASVEGGFQVTRWWYSFRGALVWGDPECQEERLNPEPYPSAHRIGGKFEPES